MLGHIELWLMTVLAGAAGSLCHELTHYVIARAAGARNVQLHWPYVYYEAPDHIARQVNTAPLVVAIGWAIVYLHWHGAPSLSAEYLPAAAFFIGYTAFGGREDRTVAEARVPTLEAERILSTTASGERTLARDVVVADSAFGRARGMIGRGEPAPGTALVFPFPTVKPRGIHMVGVRHPLDVVWLADGQVTAVKRCRPWLGHGRAECDTIVELPAGVAAGIEPGDTISFE